MKRALRVTAVALAAMTWACTPEALPPESTMGLDPNVFHKLRDLALTAPPTPRPDVSNRWADNLDAARLGHQFFFEKRFSGALLDDSNQGAFAGSLGSVGETGKVSCSGCHLPPSFSDFRTPRGQNSLGAGWTRRRAPSLLDVGQATFLMWDGHRDTAYSQVFTPIEDSIELNSSRLFVAQQVATLYKQPYEALFGPLPVALANYAPVAPANAGCNTIPDGESHGTCDLPGHDDPDVTRVVVNVGKAISAFTRKLTCGQSRFDHWVAGDATALTEQEIAGAVLFVGKAGCATCHSGPYFTDQQFHNVGMPMDIGLPGIPADFHDSGASEGLNRARTDVLGAKGAFSDGDDGRQSWLEGSNLSKYLGAFKTPTLRCVSKRPSFGHTAAFRVLDDIVLFFAQGGASSGYLGVSENVPRDLSREERVQLTAFLRALDGPGPDAEWVAPPTLP